MLIKYGTQSTHIYQNPEIEKIRYNPYRLKNRQIAEEAYANNVHLPFPLHVIVETSSLCQLQCGFCNRSVMSRPQMNMSMETFKKIADQCAEGGVYSLSLYALGEPMLNPNIGSMIKYAKNKGIPYVDLSTNGMIDLFDLCDSGLNEVIISLDGNKKTHEKLRPGSNYNKIVHNVKILEEDWDYRSRPLIRLQIIDIPETHDLIPEYIETWKEVADVICIKRLETMSANLGTKLISAEELQKRLNTRTPCKLMYFSVTVCSNGDICYCPHDPKGESVLGNIDSMTIKQVWDNVMPIREMHRKGKYTGLCMNCGDFASW